MSTAPGRRFAMLTNPLAGRGRARIAPQRAADRLRASGASVTELIGHDADDALRLAREAVSEEPDALVACGGDGLVALAVRAAAGTGVPVGIVPTGTGNDHAREYGIPLDDPAAAADVIVRGRVRTVDLGIIRAADGTRRRFGTVLATGFDSLVTDRTNRMRWPRGRMRYNVAIVAEFLALRPLPFRLELTGMQHAGASGGAADAGAGGASGGAAGSGERVIERDAVLAAIGNTRSYGGGMLICPDADPADGLLDVTIIRYVPRRTLIRLLPTVFRGTHVRRREVETLRARSVRVSAPGITAYADGEPVGPLPTTVEVEDGALRILVP